MLLDLKHITNISVKHRLEIKKVVTLSQLKDFIQVMKIYDEHVQDIYLNLWNHLQIKDTPLSLYVGYVHDSPVSIGSLFSHEKEGLLTNLITLPEYRGMGFATQMMKYRIQEAARNGCQQVFLTASNDVSKYISEKLGFVSLGEKYDCYECTGALEK